MVAIRKARVRCGNKIIEKIECGTPRCRFLCALILVRRRGLEPGFFFGAPFAPKNVQDLGQAGSQNGFFDFAFFSQIGVQGFAFFHPTRCEAFAFFHQTRCGAFAFRRGRRSGRVGSMKT